MGDSLEFGRNNQETRPSKRPDIVFEFLFRYNFGSPHKDLDKAMVSAEDAVDGVAYYIKERLDNPLLANEPSMLSLVAEVLEEAGYAAKGSINREEWSNEFEAKLAEALDGYKEMLSREGSKLPENRP